MADVDPEKLPILEAVAKAAQRWLRACKDVISGISRAGVAGPNRWTELADSESELAKLAADYELLAEREK
jgi:hypothetical protein